MCWAGAQVRCAGQGGVRGRRRRHFRLEEAEDDIAAAGALRLQLELHLEGAGGWRKDEQQTQKRAFVGLWQITVVWTQWPLRGQLPQSGEQRLPLPRCSLLEITAQQKGFLLEAQQECAGEEMEQGRALFSLQQEAERSLHPKKQRKRVWTPRPWSKWP